MTTKKQYKICAGWDLEKYPGSEVYIEELELGYVDTYCSVHKCDAWDCFSNDPILELR